MKSPREFRLSSPLSFRSFDRVISKFSSLQLGRQHPAKTHAWQLFKGILYGLSIASVWSVALPTPAAERITLRLGPIEQPITLEDVENFAETGEVPSGLRLFAPVLTDEVRQALRSHIQLNPDVSDRLVDDLLRSTEGGRLLETLELAMPESSPEDIQQALKLAVHDTNGLSLLGFLRAFPDETITLDTTSAIALVSQLNLPYWQSHALSSALERELTIPSDPFYAAFDPTTRGYERVRQQTLKFKDRKRDRTIPVDLYWSRWSRGPLVVISHGFGADRRFLSYLAQHLASQGLTVAALEHPGSNVAWLAGITLGESGSGRLSDILPATEFIDRPNDVSFLLDELDRLNRYSSILEGRLNTDKVTVIGHSLGGYTALALAGATLDIASLQQFCNERSLVELSPADWLQCTATDLSPNQPSFRDSRVSRVIALNPVMGRIFGESGLSMMSTPAIILSATEDSITPAVSQQLLPFSQLTNPDQLLLTAIGGTHLSAGDPANLNYALTQSLFLRERRRDETDGLRQMLQGISLAFVKQDTPEADLYASFLTPDYVQAWSTDSIKLRLNSDVPPQLRDWFQMAAGPLEQVISPTLPKRKKHQRETMLTASINYLSENLPLMMFIPPLSLPLAASRFFSRPRRYGRYRRRSRS
ncbi:MAG: alpha/beta hydrolase [Elainellaceae cyanobacterium]